MALTRIQLRPGVIKTTTDYSVPGTIVDMLNARFVGDVPEKIGGWIFLVENGYIGAARGMLAWRDTDDNRLLGFGTNFRFYVWTGGALNNVTPLDDSGTLTSPFTVSNGSATVTVTDAGHGRALGDLVTFSNADTLWGADFNGTWTVTAVLSSSQYQFQYTSTITTLGGYGTGSYGQNPYSYGLTGGGSSVNYSYELGHGLEHSIRARGYGAGFYGRGTYGTARSSTTPLHAATWTMAVWGEDLLICRRGGNIYVYDTSAGGRASTASGAPTSNTAIFVTRELHVVALGAGGEFLRIEWSDQDDRTDWTATSTNQAGGYTLPGGTSIVGGTAWRDQINLIWTERATWIMTYLAREPWFSFREVGATGLYGPHAYAQREGVIFWMGDGDFFAYDGYVRALPSDPIRDYVFEDINKIQRAKVWCVTNTEHKEVTWLYCSADSQEIDRSVTFYPETGYWAVNRMARTTGVDRDIFDYPIYAGSQNLYEHERGTDDVTDALDSYITTAPADVADGLYVLDFTGLIPDFQNQVGAVDFYFITKDKPNDTATTSDAYAAAPSTDRIDTRESGRQAGIKMQSNAIGGDWRLGAVRLEYEVGDERI